MHENIDQLNTVLMLRTCLQLHFGGDQHYSLSPPLGENLYRALAVIGYRRCSLTLLSGTPVSLLNKML